MAANPPLPVNIDFTYPDDLSDQTIRLHQQHHDVIHASINRQLPISVLEYGAVGDGVANDSAAIVNAIAAAKALRYSAGLVRVAVFFPRGRYRTAPFNVPGGVSLVGEGYGASSLVNIGTNGGVFILMAGSQSFCEKLTIDGQRAINTGTVGLAAVQFSHLNNMTAGSLSISGGVILTASTTVGGTSIAVNTAAPAGEDIVPGDVLTLVEGSNYEMVRVAPTYTPGALTLPLVGTMATVFTVAAQVSVASTDVGISDCRVYSNGRDGVAFWHVIYGYVDRNKIYDSSDTSIDLPSAGSRFVRIRGNDIESNGTFGISFDTADTEFGRVADCTSEGNTIRFLTGGVAPFPADGVYFGNVDRCMSRGDTVDLSRTGVDAVGYRGSSTHCHVVDINVIGNTTPRAATRGICQTVGAADLKMRVSGGCIRGVEVGIDLDQVRTAVVSNVDVSNCSAYAVNALGDPAHVQLITVLGVAADGHVTGIRFGATPMAGNKVTTTGCVLTGSSFAPIVADPGWNHVATGNVP